MKGHHDRDKGIGISFDGTFLAAGMRTPFGRYCGSLSQVSPTDLGIVAARAVLKRSGIGAGEIDQVIAANIGQSSYDAYFLPRHISLYSGVPESVPALLVQRICGSGFEVLITAAEQVMLGKAATVLCAGTENMSLAPTVSFGNRMGYALGQPVFKDMLWEALDDTAAGYPMGFTAENVAKKHNLSREDCDRYALLSYQRALKAVNEKLFLTETTPVQATTFERDGLQPRSFRLANGNKILASDEHIRQTTAEGLAGLPAVFSEVGVLTAGNCSGIVDGAGAAIVMGETALKAKGLKPLSKLVAAASSGIDPKLMGLGPVPAIRYLLEISGLRMEDIGLVEINEAFSAQVIGCERELNIDRDRLNVNGGAIAIGHPLAATGLRLSVTISHELKRRNLRYGIVSACIGGGQGTALLLENTDFKP
jgi:acetyl-CoA C-acetyltransferase